MINFSICKKCEHFELRKLPNGKFGWLCKNKEYIGEEESIRCSSVKNCSKQSEYAVRTSSSVWVDIEYSDIDWSVIEVEDDWSSVD